MYILYHVRLLVESRHIYFWTTDAFKRWGNPFLMNFALTSVTRLTSSVLSMLEFLWLFSAEPMQFNGIYSVVKMSEFL